MALVFPLSLGVRDYHGFVKRERPSCSDNEGVHLTTRDTHVFLHLNSPEWDCASGSGSPILSQPQPYTFLPLNSRTFESRGALRSHGQ